MILKYLQILILIFTSAIFYGQNLSSNAVTTGPENGSLIIAGGGRIGAEITEKFITLAGGKNALIIVIPTAAGGKIDLENVWFVKKLKNYGATDVHILHTYDKDEADSDSFTELLKSTDAVWFAGGRQWRLVDAYGDTQTEILLQELLNRGGVIGGTSAGATIQGSYLARGDTKNNQIMMGDHEEGFGYIKNIAIDQHVLARNRQFDMFDILKNRPELLGIGIDESTAIVVQGDEFEVIGESNVLIYDGTFWSREGSDLKSLPKKENIFYFLQNGDRYDMRDRKVITE
jgi:cyanophycinase